MNSLKKYFKPNSIAVITEKDIYSVMLEEKKSNYDNKAKLYETLVDSKWYNQIAWGTSPTNYKEFAAKAISNAKGLSIDIGCGGLLHTYQCYINNTEQFVLVDNAIQMLQLAKKRLKGHQNDLPNNISLLQADALHLPFLNETFDNLFCFGVLHCFEDRMSFIKQTLRLLKPGGNFFFSCLTTDRWLSKMYLNILAKQNQVGFPLSSSQTIELFSKEVTTISYYQIGSMIFIEGKK